MSSANAMKDLTARVEEGIKVTKAAIARGDALRVGDCLRHFAALNAPIDKIYEAIEECPVSLIEEAGYCLIVKSALLGREIILGKDIPWQEVISLLQKGLTGKDLMTVLETRELFEGKVVLTDSPSLFDTPA
ncbi:MAG TPA: hypothetical protein VMU21_12200 [Thermodesulfovibrionales bacterium]|nr:hypothetical protein [Thermodesulfovibrionales bacterium]